MVQYRYSSINVVARMSKIQWWGRTIAPPSISQR